MPERAFLKDFAGVRHHSISQYLLGPELLGHGGAVVSRDVAADCEVYVLGVQLRGCFVLGPARHLPMGSGGVPAFEQPVPRICSLALSHKFDCTLRRCGVQNTSSDQWVLSWGRVRPLSPRILRNPKTTPPRKVSNELCPFILEDCPLLEESFSLPRSLEGNLLGVRDLHTHGFLHSLLLKSRLLWRM